MVKQIVGDMEFEVRKSYAGSKPKIIRTVNGSNVTSYVFNTELTNACTTEGISYDHQRMIEKTLKQI